MTKVGIDIGGTFTDVILLDEQRTVTYKLPSTPDNPAQAALEGLATLVAREGIAPATVAMVAHGTTVATNTVIQRKGAKTALITTHGFRDVLEIARLGRPPEAIYDIQFATPPPLVPRHLRFEVRERVNYRGQVTQPLDEAEVVQLARHLRAAQIEAVAVCLLYSFLHPEHERTVKRLLQGELPQVEIFLSSDILPERREYERTSTTVIAAYLAPAVTHYIRHMQGELARLSLQDKFYIMQSNGGLNTPETAMLNPATMVLSGPAGGAIAAAYLGELAGFRDLISVDMGGTSFDVCLIRHGEQLLSTETKVFEHPLNVPMLDIHTIGAGGGSLAWLDAGGGLRVGPHSAGAHPGPACYGQGGMEPTVTDANVVLGFLNPAYLLGGGMSIEPSLAAAAIRRAIGQPLGLLLPEAAEGIYRIINATMAGAIRVISVEKGYDPREFALIAFGGAGPVHAAELAEEMAIPWVLVPRHPGITSAAGLVLAELLHDYVQTLVAELSGLDLRRWNKLYGALEARGNLNLGRDRVPASDRLFQRLADLKYVGQGYHLTVPVPGGLLGEPERRMVLERFHARHEQLYGFAAPEEPVELVNVRVRAVGRLPRLQPAAMTAGPQDPRAAQVGERTAFFRRAGGMIRARVHDRTWLRPGHVIEGPAIVEQLDSTTVIPPEMSATVDGYENLVVGRAVWRQHGLRRSNHV